MCLVDSSRPYRLAPTSFHKQQGRLGNQASRARIDPTESKPIRVLGCQALRVLPAHHCFWHVYPSPPRSRINNLSSISLRFEISQSPLCWSYCSHAQSNRNAMRRVCDREMLNLQARSCHDQPYSRNVRKALTSFSVILCRPLASPRPLVP